MPIAAIPQGVELRKITPTQKNALDDLLKKQKEGSLLQTAVAVTIPSVALLVASGAAVALFYYKKELEDYISELPTTVATAAGGKVADVITDLGGAVARAAGFSDDPTTPEYLPSGIGPLSRCERWSADAVDILSQIQAGGLSSSQKVQAALAIRRVAKNMKAEGCSRPTAISQSQWDES
jgi:hypothetical protein